MKNLTKEKKSKMKTTRNRTKKKTWETVKQFLLTTLSRRKIRTSM